MFHSSIRASEKTESLKEETWKPIPAYDGFYEASSQGRVRSVSRIRTNESLGPKRLTGRILKQINQGGYKRVALCVSGKRKDHYVHRLVFSAFHGSIENSFTVDHINEIKTDNRLLNLRAMSRGDNCRAYRGNHPTHGCVYFDKKNKKWRGTYKSKTTKRYALKADAQKALIELVTTERNTCPQ